MWDYAALIAFSESSVCKCSEDSYVRILSVRQLLLGKGIAWVHSIECNVDRSIPRWVKKRRRSSFVARKFSILQTPIGLNR